MKNNIQIGLFYISKTIFEPVKFANMILEKMPEFGKPSILPYNISSEANEDVPVILFQEFLELQIVVSFTNILVTINEDAKTKKEDILKNIFKIFDKFDINITRVGYVINTFSTSLIEINAFKNNNFNLEETKNANEVQLSFHNLIEIGNYSCNYWQRYVLSKELGGLITTLDVNTLLTDKHDIDKSFVLDFIKDVDKYVSNK